MRVLKISVLAACLVCFFVAWTACANYGTDNGTDPNTESSESTLGTGAGIGGSEILSAHKIDIYDGETYIKTVYTDEAGRYTLSEMKKTGYTFVGFFDRNGEAFPTSGTIASDCRITVKYVPPATTTFEELKARLEAGAPEVCITQDIELTDSIFVVGRSTVYVHGNVTLTRSPAFLGDLFIVGETPGGKNIVEETGGTNSLTLKAEGTASLTIDGNKQNITDTVNGTAILIVNSSSVTLDGNITVQNCRKTGNEKILQGYITNSDPHKIGGAVSIVLNGRLEIKGATIKDNEVSATDAVSGDTTVGVSSCGGAIFNYSNLVIHDGVFSGNSAARGGAVYNYKDATVVGGDFIQNHAYVYGGAMYLVNSQFTSLHIGTKEAEDMTDVLFENNTSKKSGGAIFAQLQASVVVYGGTTFTGNQSMTGNGGALNVAGALTVHDAIFSHNVAASKGGAIYAYYSDTTEAMTARQVNIYGGAFTKNQSPKGGAIACMASAEKPQNKSAVVYIGAVTFTDNEAYLTTVDGAELPANAGDGATGTYNGKGGAIYVSRKTKLTVDGACFTGNLSGNQGGAIYNTGDSLLTLKNIIFTENRAGGNGGAIYATTDSRSVVSDVTFKQNTAKGGGGVFATSASRLTFANVRFEGNQATDGNGGAIYASGKTDGSVGSIEGLMATNNSAAKGGFLYITTGGTTVELISKATFAGETAVINGNTATDGGNLIFSNSNSSVIKINRTEFAEWLPVGGDIAGKTGGIEVTE